MSFKRDPAPKARCPYCQRRTALTRDGKLWQHKDPATGRICGRSGGMPR